MGLTSMNRRRRRVAPQPDDSPRVAAAKVALKAAEISYRTQQYDSNMRVLVAAKAELDAAVREARDTRPAEPVEADPSGTSQKAAE